MATSTKKAVYSCKQCSKEFIAWICADRKFCSLSCSLIGNKRWKPSSLEIPGMLNHIRNLKEKSKGENNFFYGKKGEQSPNWKGGRYMSQAGYVMVTRYQQRPIPLHRLLMEEFLGRKLSKNEHVHHIDENPLNNEIDNLQLMTKAEHISHHTTLRNQKMLRYESGRFLCLK